MLSGEGQTCMTSVQGPFCFAMPANENTGTGSVVITKGSSMEECLLFLVGPAMDYGVWELLTEG